MTRIPTRVKGLAAMAALGLTLTACGSSSNNDASAPDTSGGSSSSGGATCDSGLELAFLGAASGPNGALGQNMIGGIKLAVSEFNQANPNCQVTFGSSDVFDSQGDPTKATPLGQSIVGNDNIVGLIGPGFSGESDATGATFNDAGLPSISPSATNVQLTQNGWTYWHRVIGNDAAQGAGDAKYLTDTVKAQKVFVIDDSEDYGTGLADVVKSSLGGAVAGTDSVQVGSTDFSATVAKVQAANADAVFYGGYYAESGLLVKQLRQAGYTGTFMSGDGSEDPSFVKVAGADAANGALLSAPAGPAPADFNTKYKAVNSGSNAGLYSTQAYDATNIFLQAIAAGNTDRDSINTFIGSYSGDGVSGPIKFDQNGDITGGTIYVYKVENGELNTTNPDKVQ